MSEEQQVPNEEKSGSNVDASWQEVGRQFQALGESLAQAVRTAWENEETQRRVHEMRAGLQNMAQEVGKAVEETANSEPGRKIRTNVESAADSVRTATEQTVQEARPQIINALQQLNAELQKLVDRLESKRSPVESSTPEDPANQDPQI